MKLISHDSVDGPGRRLATPARVATTESPLTESRPPNKRPAMTATAFLELKQRASKLPEKDRQNLSAFLLRLGQERDGWKQETARRLNAMADGKKVSVAELRKQLRHS